MRSDESLACKGFLLLSNLLLISPDNREVKLNALQSRTKISFLDGNGAEGFCLKYSRYSFFGFILVLERKWHFMLVCWLSLLYVFCVCLKSKPFETWVELILSLYC